MASHPGSTSQSALPSGTVTFLFTDIEGSTRLLQHLGKAYTGLLAALRDDISTKGICAFGKVVLGLLEQVTPQS